MNHLSTSICTLLILAMSYGLHAQEENTGKVETSFKVEGVCDMCKKRIEDAAYGKGVLFAEWDKETRLLQVVYRPKKTTLQAIHKRLADAGHSTNEMEANKDAYDKLPKCCAYHDGVETH